jgi:two-component system, cell cycle sensor histidine kinase and response regulator CckA
MSVSDSNRPRGVLAIDDEPDILDVVRIALEGAGYKVFTASSGKGGLELYEQHRQEIDVVLLDYLMPELTGDLVFECLRNINPNVRVLLLTACDDRVARLLFEGGLRGYIQKPFYLDDLIARVGEEAGAL